jgi:hypothetical protein
MRAEMKWRAVVTPPAAVVLAAQSPEAIEMASIKLGDQHSSSTAFRFLPGVRVRAVTFPNLVLFAYDLRESSLESEFLL